MAEYIEREALLVHKTLIPGFIGEYVCVDRIIEAPSADVAPVVHGRWIETYHEGYEMWGYDCSECDDGFATKERCKSKPNYCHNCGARMDGDGNG